MAKAIDSWNDLREFGIDYLTGESCPYGMRTLCDLSEKGAKTVRDMLGMPANAPLGENWNSGRGNKTGVSVASMMLPRGILAELAVFCLFADGAAKVSTHMDGKALGFYVADSQEEWDRHLEYARHANLLERTYSPIGGPRLGSRMVHAMSGLTE